MITRYLNTASTAGGDGTTNAIIGATRAYATLSEAKTALHLGSLTDDLELLCCGSIVDISTASVEDWTDASHTTYIRGNPLELDGKNPGYWSELHYRLVCGSSLPVLLVNGSASVVIEGIQFDQRVSIVRTVQ